MSATWKMGAWNPPPVNIALVKLGIKLQLKQLFLSENLEGLNNEKKGNLGVFVDGNDGLGVLHAGQVLDGSRDADGDVQVRRHDLARLSNLMRKEMKVVGK